MWRPHSKEAQTAHRRVKGQRGALRAGRDLFPLDYFHIHLTYFPSQVDTQVPLRLAGPHHEPSAEPNTERAGRDQWRFVNPITATTVQTNNCSNQLFKPPGTEPTPVIVAKKRLCARVNRGQLPGNGRIRATLRAD